MRFLNSLMLAVMVCVPIAITSQVHQKKTSTSSSKDTNHQYGVVDVDSVLLSIPKSNTALSKIDSIIQQQQITSEPIQQKIQQKIISLNLSNASDSITPHDTYEEMQLLYQELYLIEQKSKKAMQPYLQDIMKCITQMNDTIAKMGN